MPTLWKDKRYSGGIILLFLIVVIGILFRSYNFSSWLHFELDQARDALIISKAYENGPGELPLLGPRAGGTYLRLGPTFYYLEYISALIFGNTPSGMAAFVLILSIATLPLFYLLVRRFFDEYLSLALLALYSFSLFIIMYSRFAWNPNPLPFFVILLFYSLLRVSSKEETKKGLWLMIASISLAIATQLHFLAFIVLPLIALIFLVYERVSINWRYWLGAVFIILLFYSPVIINDLKTGGDNLKEFREAITDKSDKKPASVQKKIVVNYFEQSRNYFLIISSQSGPGFFRGEERKPVLYDTPCDEDCRSNIVLSLVSLIWFSLSILGILKLWKGEKEPNKKSFLTLINISLLATLLIYIPLSLDLSPRFFLMMAPIPFILIGVNLIYLKSLKLHYLGIVILSTLIITNIWSIKTRFSELARAGDGPVKISTDYVLKEKNRVTFSQEKAIFEYMKNSSRTNDYPIFYTAPPQYLPAFKYLLTQDRLTFDSISKNDIYKNGNYFYIDTTNSSVDGKFYLGKYDSKYKINEEIPFGTLTVLRISPKVEAITAENKDFSKDKSKRTNTPKRYKWNEIFGHENKNTEEDEFDELEKELD